MFMGIKINGRHGLSGQNALKGTWVCLIVRPVFLCFYLDKEWFSGNGKQTLGILSRHVSLDCIVLGINACIPYGWPVSGIDK